METYILYIAIATAIGIALLLAYINTAGSHFKAVFDKYDKVKNHLGATPEQFVAVMMHLLNIKNLYIARIDGILTDCYIPKKRTIAISNSTYQNSSISAIAVIAHEFGHSLQHSSKSFLYMFYHFLGNLLNFFLRFVVVGIIVGVVFLFIEDYVSIGWIILYCSLGILGCALFYKILTLPVEFDATNRALKLLTDEKVLNEEELKMAKKVLSAAASTYVANFLATMLGINILRKFKRR